MKGILFVSLLIAVDIIGTIYGYYYYREQLASSPIYLWVFIPDCPLYVMLFTIALILTLLGSECRLFNCIAAVGMMKYGAWTVLALLMFGDYFFAGSLMLLSSTLFVLHIGMFAEGPLLIPRRLNKNHLVVCLLWFLANDYFDYFYVYRNAEGGYAVGTHPILPSPERIPLMMVLTVTLTVVVCASAYAFSRGRMDWSVRGRIEELRGELQKGRSRRGRKSRNR